LPCASPVILLTRNLTVLVHVIVIVHCIVHNLRFLRIGHSIFCHRRIPDKKLCIDHIYPIYRTKTGNDFWLRLLRIEDVNDVRNLAPACRRCNTKKGRNAGIWVLRAILGRYEAYWVLRKVCFVALVVGLVFLLNFFS